MARRLARIRPSGPSTGAKEQIAALTKAFAVYNERNGVTIDHTLCTAVIGADGRVVDLWRGQGWQVKEIIDVLQQQAAKTALSPSPAPARAQPAAHVVSRD